MPSARNAPVHSVPFPPSMPLPPRAIGSSAIKRIHLRRGPHRCAASTDCADAIFGDILSDATRMAPRHDRRTSSTSTTRCMHGGGGGDYIDSGICFGEDYRRYRHADINVRLFREREYEGIRDTRHLSFSHGGADTSIYRGSPRDGRRDTNVGLSIDRARLAQMPRLIAIVRGLVTSYSTADDSLIARRLIYRLPYKSV